MPRKLLTFLISLLLWSVTASGARNNDFREIINIDVVKDKTGVCALRDKYGFLWVGTRTGLCCFDGNGRSVNRNASGALYATEGADISALFEHGEDIWFGSTQGLSVYNRLLNTVEAFPYKTKYGVTVSSQVQKIVDAGGGKIWILTNGQGFFVFDTATQTLEQNSRWGTFYSDITVGTGGNVYLVNLDGYLQTFSTAGHFFNQVRLPDYINDKNSLCMAYVAGNVWVSSNAYLYRYDTKSHAIERTVRLNIRGEVSVMMPWAAKTIVLGTDEGVWRFNTTTDSAVRLDSTDAGAYNALPDIKVNNISRDADSSLIVVTQMGGVSEMLWRSSDFKRISVSNSNGGRNTVNALCPATTGNGVWVGTEKGVDFYNIASDAIAANPLRLSEDVLVTSLTAVADSLWIGTRYEGLMLYNTSTGQLRRYTYDENTPYAVISNDINNVYRTRSGELFVLTGWGLCKYIPAADNFITLAELGSHTPFVAMQEDGKGQLWTATANDGLFIRYRANERFQVFHSETLGSSQVSQLFLDRNGTLWAVTQGGRVFYFDSEGNDFVQLGIYMSKDFPVKFLEESPDGDLWIGTLGGLVKVDALRTPFYYSYRTNAENLPITNAACHLANGTIMFGCDSSFWVFNAADMEADTHCVGAYVQSLSFPYLDDIDSELERLGLNVPLYTRNEIQLPYTNNTFTIRMSAARSGDTPAVRFDFKLEGVDKAWIRGAGSEVTYTDLRPGTYRFMLRPNMGGDEEISELTIVVLPPWYRTMWAYLVYTLLAVALVCYVSMVTSRKIRRHYLERIEKERMKNEHETFEAKMRFFVNLVHEIRTPLTLISIPLEQMAESAEDGDFNVDENREHIDSMQRNVNYLLGITNQLLDFRKAESNSEVQLARTRCDVKTSIADVCQRFAHPLEAAGKHLQLNLPDADVVAVVDVAKTDRVIMNIIGNAMKFSKSVVTVTVDALADNFRVVVSDDGPGIPEEERDHIFDTYYQISNDKMSASLGTGLGLAYAKLIARAHGGDIKVDNNADGGASFVLTLPLGADVVPAEVDTPELVTEESAAADTVATTAAADEATDAMAPEVTLLLVDDNADLLNTVASSLRKRYVVLTASNGIEALECLQQHHDIDIVISDFMMPAMDGAELCRHLKNDVATSHVPFIMLTAKTGNEARIEGMECGADAFIEKPFTIKQLSLQIANMLRTREQVYAHLRSTDQPAIDQPVEGEQTPLLNRIDSEFLNTLNNYIRENICDEDFSIDIMASKMNMSRSSFYRKIKGITGMTPVDYLKNFRLTYSARLLLEGVRVTEVAIMAGFTSSSYFAKCFKAKYGMIPKEYASSQSPQ